MTDPFGDFDEMAVTQHEMFESYIRAGFSKPEALELVKNIMNEQLRFYLFNKTKEEEKDG